MYPTLKASAALALLISHTPAYAQEVFDLGEITLYSSKIPVETKSTGATTEVVTEEDIAKQGQQEVGDKLNALPGVSLTQEGPTGTKQSVFVRGLPSKYVPVFFDGIDLTDTTAPQTAFDWGGFGAAGIGRVEVLKGSQSALYGSEAIGGVINITPLTLAEEGERYSFGAEYGSYDTKALSFSYLRKTERADISFTLSHLKTDGFSAADEAEGSTEADGYEGTTAILKTTYDATETLKVGATLLYQTADYNIDAFGDPAGDADRPNEQTRSAARIFAQVDGDRIDHEFSVSFANIDREDPLGYTKRFEGTRTELNYLGNTNLGGGTLSFGLLHSIETASLDGAAKDKFKSSALYAEAIMPLSSNVDLSLSGRYENHSDFGDALTGRAALAWRVSEATVIRSSVGNGFRAPSLYERFGPYGNASLREETSLSYDLGVEHTFSSGAVVKAVVFHNSIDNVIGFAGGAYSQVPGTSKSKGLELSSEYEFANGLQLTGAYTYTDSKKENDRQLERVPEHSLTLGVNADLSAQLAMGIELNHVAGRANDGGRVMENYTVVNAGLNYAVSDTAELYLRVDNLFDEQYQTVAGYGTSDRALYFGVSAYF